MKHLVQALTAAIVLATLAAALGLVTLATVRIWEAV